MNEAVISAAVAQPEQFSGGERLQLTWALVWPCTLLSVVYSLARSQSRLPVAYLQGMDQVFGILSFLLFTTWVVRRTVRLNFPGFHVLVFRGNAPEGTRTMSYQESLSVAWLISWRFAMIILPVYLAVAVWFWHRELDIYGPLSLVSSTVVEFMIFYFWLVKAALNKPYAHFSLRLDRSTPKSA